MTRRPATKPRKSASQARSRQTVDVLLEATARVLIKEGYDKTTTNKIAAVAGVSIGSLYQYFPDKPAVARALAERYGAEVADAWAPLVAEAKSLNFDVDPLHGVDMQRTIDRILATPDDVKRRAKHLLQ